jgi:hypothetical protein
VREWLSSYAAYFSPKYLFIAANSELRNIYPDTGPFLFWELPFLLAGAVVLIRTQNNRLKMLMILLLAVSPLAASLVHQPFGMIRALPLVIPISVLIALGINWLTDKWHIWGTVAVLVLVMWGLGRLYLSVFKLNDYYRYQYWDWGTDKVVEEINKYPDENILVDGWRSELYSQLLFFTRYDPVRYQTDNPLADLADYYGNGPINLVKHIGRITFKPIDYNRDVYNPGIIVGSYKMFGDKEIREFCMTKLFTVRGPDNFLMFTAARTNPGLLKEYNQLTKNPQDKEHNCLLYMSVTSPDTYVE